MTIDRAKTIEMARQADPEWLLPHPDVCPDEVAALERFAALVRARAIEEAIDIVALFGGSVEIEAALRRMKSDSVHPAAADGCASTAPLPCVACITPAVCKRDAGCFHPTSPRQEQHDWRAGLIDRVKAAAKRIDDNRAPRSIPADPHSDVDLVLAEVRCFLEGSAPPFWVPGAPRCRSADTARHGQDVQELNLESPSVLLVEDQPGGGG